MKNTYQGVVSEEITNAKEFIVQIKNDSQIMIRRKQTHFLLCLITMNYKGKGNVRDHIMEMSHIFSKIEFYDDMLVHLVFFLLPTQYNQFKVSYNYQKGKWSLNE